MDGISTIPGDSEHCRFVNLCYDLAKKIQDNDFDMENGNAERANELGALFVENARKNNMILEKKYDELWLKYKQHILEHFPNIYNGKKTGMQNLIYKAIDLLDICVPNFEK